jgi:transposase
MELYVGLDVSLKETSICVVDGKGSLVVEGVVASSPGEIAAFLMSKASAPVRVGLETGPTATWLWHELRAFGLPVICIDARHAKAALSMQINKSDRNDAFGLARIMQSGWYKEVRVKSLDSHRVRALLNSRALLVKIKRDIENQIRGLLKNLGLLIGKARGKAFTLRAEELMSDSPVLSAAIGPLLARSPPWPFSPRSMIRGASNDQEALALMSGLRPDVMPRAKSIGRGASRNAAMPCCDPTYSMRLACC